MATFRPLLLAVATAFVLAACAPVDQAPPPGDPTPTTPPVAEAPPVKRDDDTMSCDNSGTSWAVGKLADETLVTRVRTETHSKSVRVIKPGMAVTMDYRTDRVNIDVDAENKVVSVRCG